MATRKEASEGRGSQQQGLTLLRSEPGWVGRARQGMRVLYGEDLKTVAEHPAAKSVSRMSHYRNDEAHRSAAAEIIASVEARAEKGDPREDVELFVLWVMETVARAYRDAPAVQLTTLLASEQRWDSEQDVARTDCLLADMSPEKLERLKKALGHEVAAKRATMRAIDWHLREARTA